MSTLPSDKTWKIYGKKAPYFGVFGQEMYLNDNLNEEVLNNFFSSGSSYVDYLFTTIYNKIDSNFKAEKILDFGCGPGRMVIPFSRYAEEVIGMDISREVLDEAQKNCNDRNLSNVTFLLSDDDLQLIRGIKFDLIHSFIVLQHLNIKRGEKLVRLLLDHLNENGIGVLHLTYYDNYPERTIVNFFRFRIPYLSRIMKFIRAGFKRNQLSNLPQMQMNNYNLNKIFALLQKANVNEVYTTFTNHHNYWGVVLYFKTMRRDNQQ
jgi:ubiquinone/menaquinone biosynthesis C-methylase UbiE